MFACMLGWVFYKVIQIWISGYSLHVLLYLNNTTLVTLSSGPCLQANMPTCAWFTDTLMKATLWLPSVLRSVQVMTTQIGDCFNCGTGFCKMVVANIIRPTTHVWPYRSIWCPVFQVCTAILFFQSFFFTTALCSYRHFCNALSVSPTNTCSYWPQGTS